MRGLCSTQIAPAPDGDDGGTDSIDDQIMDRVGKAGGITRRRRLHVRPEPFVHGEFEDFPDRTQADRKEEGEQGDKGRAHVQIDVAILVQHVDEYEAEHAEEEPGRCVQSSIPPPEAFVIIVHLTKEERGKHEQHRDELNFRRNFHRHSENHRRERQGHDPGHEKGLGPFLLKEQQDQLNCHDELKESQDREMRPSGCFRALGWYGFIPHFGFAS